MVGDGRATMQQAASLTTGHTGRRAGVPSGTCPSPHPFSDMLPAMFHEDDLVLAFVAGLDDVLVPALVLLDCLSAYIDPVLAPVDFLAWLAGWVGLSLDQRWPATRRRALVRQATELYRWQGTARGLSAHVELCTGAGPEIVDPGGVAWSQTPRAPLPGRSGAEIVVRVREADAAGTDASELAAIVAAASPANIAHRVEIV